MQNIVIFLLWRYLFRKKLKQITKTVENYSQSFIEYEQRFVHLFLSIITFDVFNVTVF